MKDKDFLIEFDAEHFPKSFGPWIGIDAHDPPFTSSQLKQAEKQGLLVFNPARTQYRLTLKATAVRESAPATAAEVRAR